MTKQELTQEMWVLQALQQSCQLFKEYNQPVYLVGGSIRNLLLQKPCVDWDIATSGNTPDLARRLADRLGGFYAHMHEKASRVIVKHGQQDLMLDISPLQGADIQEDLSRRDFTINALAAPFAEVLAIISQSASPARTHAALSEVIIDPHQGLQDLATRTLRVTTETSFQKDPLRLLRAMRFSQQYQLTIEPDTARYIARDAYLLPQVAHERIHEELYTLLRPAGTYEHLLFLDTHHLLTTLIPELEPARGMAQPSLHHWDVFGHSLAAVAMLEKLGSLLQQSPEEVQRSELNMGEQNDLLELQKLLQEAEQQHVFSFAQLLSPPLKLAALLHDIGKPITRAVDKEGNITFYHHPQAGVPVAQQITQRLGVSTHDKRLIQQVVAHHMRPGQLSNTTITPRAIRRYFVDMGPNGIYVALVSLADHLAMRGPDPLTIHWQRHLATVRTLLTRYIREREQVLPPRLIQSEELIRRFQLQPGPLIGQILEAIAEAQAEGEVHSKEEVLWFTEEKLQQIRANSEK
ncbi:HD domain-containing protein [Dictyobacter formicarum]|uniref:Polynucleotide adenylyltransferase n=1 Tax=Dictyobacter formicarum TaxID=2778368 RepID=A0ABQ3VFZ9_9CHLR|nr:HD domain-containing protein [Dictyobacter formicarum]GHO84636.1 polynucleotide adenylyltransferase [Dictyobacter formicarum]